MRAPSTGGYCGRLGGASLCRRNRNIHIPSGGIMGVLIDGKWNDGEQTQETSQTS
jgi:hypothetical protein